MRAQRKRAGTESEASMEKTGAVVKRRLMLASGAVALLGFGLVGMAPLASASAGHHSHPGGFNKKGDILIADQFNNRVIEINRHHQVVWSFGNGSNVPGPHSIVGTNDAQRVGNLTL